MGSGRYDSQIQTMVNSLSQAQFALLYRIKKQNEFPIFDKELVQQGWRMRMLNKPVLNRRGASGLLERDASSKKDSGTLFCRVWHVGSREDVSARDLEKLDGVYGVDRSVGRWVYGLGWIERSLWDRRFGSVVGEASFIQTYRMTMRTSFMEPWMQLLFVFNRMKDKSAKA
jgi:hypothetical protein